MNDTLGDFNPDDGVEQKDEPTDADEDMTYPTEPQPLEDVMADETTHSVSESADKITLTTNVKRGSGTRDEDKIRVKVKGSDPETTVAKLDNTLSNLERFNVVDQLRETQAGESDE